MTSRLRTTAREDLITVVLAFVLVAGGNMDGWAHSNLSSSLESFFTPWHGILYAGLAGTAGWTFWLAYTRRAAAPRWWRDGWPAGYRVGALGALLFAAGGLGDMIWHETIGIEIGLNAQFSPSHLLLVIGGVLLVSSPLRAWWAAGEGGLRTVTGVISLALTPTVTTILLSHSSAFLSDAPVRPFDPGLANGGLASPAGTVALLGVDAFVFTTPVIAIPFLLAHRRRPTLGAGAAVTAGTALFGMFMFEFPAPMAFASFTAILAALLADVIVVWLDAVRGPRAALRLPIAGAIHVGLVWSGLLLGLHLDAGLRWPIEMITGIVVITAALGALLGGLAAPPASHLTPDPQRSAAAPESVPSKT
ncbi:hypothetical protein [Catenuloplanes atrovinosus]|uniref:Uncharacterized protein n=1 Tax=Catenuloplanes atrovinosus TaxID=137266 RepID=A0AAE3YWK0_9ACTN|nr:hypothetical protein [Catenuloplanes atrovinosus]MDR7279723.1 hypothetical protein [Catenuloplanes atrovinosus]